MAISKIKHDSLEDSAVNSAKIENATVDTADLKDDSVTKDKIDTTVASTGKSIAMAIVFG